MPLWGTGAFGKPGPAQQTPSSAIRSSNTGLGTLDMNEFPTLGQATAKSYSTSSANSNGGNSIFGGGQQQYTSRPGTQSPMPMSSRTGPPGLAQQQSLDNAHQQQLYMQSQQQQLQFQQQQHQQQQHQQHQQHQIGLLPTHGDQIDDKNWPDSPLAGLGGGSTNAAGSSALANNSYAGNLIGSLVGAPGASSSNTNGTHLDEGSRDYGEQQRLEHEYSNMLRRNPNDVWNVQQQAQQQSRPADDDNNERTLEGKEVKGESMPFGLSGLMNFMKLESNNDLALLAMGSDLTTLGLNLNQPE